MRLGVDIDDDKDDDDNSDGGDYDNDDLMKMMRIIMTIKKQHKYKLSMWA